MPDIFIVIAEPQVFFQTVQVFWRFTMRLVSADSRGNVFERIVTLGLCRHKIVDVFDPRGFDFRRDVDHHQCGSIDPVFTKADLGSERGVYYRLRTQPNARASAKELCGELSKRGIDCLVVKSEAPQSEVTSG